MPTSFIILIIAIVATCLPGIASAAAPTIQLQKVLDGFERPVFVGNDGATDALYVAEQKGRIIAVEDGHKKAAPFLDIHERIVSGGECGLLGLAFHPSYAQNGKIYVNYTAREHKDLYTFISQFTADPKSFQCDPKSEKVLMKFKQPWSNHNGGGIAFGPDGMLYIGSGDGGSGGDPQNNGLNLRTPLGKILRIDVNQGNPYAVPPDNPFFQKPDCLKEIWAYGLRNPWRFSFDRKTGACYAGDVGQNKLEEIDLIERGKNYGWSAREGNQPFKPERATTAMEDPIKVYGRNLGVSITGGYVYRGTAIPSLDGVYLYADYQSGRIWGLKYEGGRLTMDEQLLDSKVSISSFGEDRAGEHYVCDHHGGKILKLVPK